MLSTKQFAWISKRMKLIYDHQVSCQKIMYRRITIKFDRKLFHNKKFQNQKFIEILKLIHRVDAKH